MHLTLDYSRATFHDFVDRSSVVYRSPRQEPIAVELYDHEDDPKENLNLADRPGYAGVVSKLTAQFWRGWRDALPR